MEGKLIAIMGIDGFWQDNISRKSSKMWFWNRELEMYEHI